MLSFKLLILEDDLLTLSKLLAKLSNLEDSYHYEFRPIILSDYTQVQDYVNNNPKADFDIILLDRDCKLGGSFHVLDIERFGAHKIISISSVPDYNEQALKRGVKRVVYKDYSDLDRFATDLAKEIAGMITDTR